MKGLILSGKTFKCEICGCETPIECEGAEPNTRAMCVPIVNDTEIDTQCHES